MKSIVLLATDADSTNIIYHALKRRFHISHVIMEEPVPLTTFIKRRIKTLGFVRVFGQVLFYLCALPFVRFFSRRRIRALKERYSFESAPIDHSIVVHVSSANSEETIALLKRVQPDLVLINGTRILSKKVLTSIPAAFVNMHAGITPRYRGVHGAYWALRNHDREHCGVTVHVVDPGIDTGDILDQGIIHPQSEDNFVTYPLLQMGVGIPLLEKTVSDMLRGEEEMKTPPGPSRLWSHPTLWGYLWYRVVHGVK